MKKREACNISDKIVKALTAKRKALGVSRYQISKDTGISQSSLLYIERLTQYPSVPMLIILAEYLKEDVSPFFKDLSNKK